MRSANSAMSAESLNIEMLSVEDNRLKQSYEATTVWGANEILFVEEHFEPSGLLSYREHAEMESPIRKVSPTPVSYVSVIFLHRSLTREISYVMPLKTNHY